MDDKYNKEIVLKFETRAEAEEVLEKLNEYLTEWGNVSYADYVDVVGPGIGTNEDVDYGWLDLKDVSVSWIIGIGYVFILPPPVLLSNADTSCKVCAFNEDEQFNLLEGVSVEFKLGNVGESFQMDLYIEARTNAKDPCISVTLFDEHSNIIEEMEYTIKYCPECGRKL